MGHNVRTVPSSYSVCEVVVTCSVVQSQSTTVLRNNLNAPRLPLNPRMKEIAYIMNRDPPSGNFQGFCGHDLVRTGKLSGKPPPPTTPHPE